MKSLFNSAFSLLILLAFIMGCGSPNSQISPEAQAREDFASTLRDKTSYRVVFSAQGNDKEILDIGVIEEVAPYKASDVVDFILSDDLKKNAKALKFKQIIIKGGRKSFGDPDTINTTINL